MNEKQLQEEIRWLQKRIDDVERTSNMKIKMLQDNIDNFVFANDKFAALKSFSNPSTDYKHKDTTRYLFNNKEYNKRQFVYQSVRKIITDRQCSSLKQAQELFPRGLHNIFEVVEDYDIASGYQGDRFYLKPEELIHFENGDTGAICKQWDINNITDYIKHIRSMGYYVEERKKKHEDK